MGGIRHGRGGNRPLARPILADERVRTGDVAASRNEAISYAAYRVLVHRYRESPGAEESLPSFDALLADLGYHPSNETTRGNSAAAVGNRAALRVIRHGLADGADELGEYAFENGYEPVNSPLFVALPGAGELADPNRWQPLSLLEFIDQAGRRQAGNVQRFIGSHWGEVTPFALPRAALAAPGVYHDPGAPPNLRGDRSAEYRDAFAEVVRFSATLDPDDGVLMDIGPGALGGNSLGANDGRGYARNPVTGPPVRRQRRQARRLDARHRRVLGRRPRLRDAARPLEHAGQLRHRSPAATPPAARRRCRARPAGVGRQAVPGPERGVARRRGRGLGHQGPLRLRAADHRDSVHGATRPVLRPLRTRLPPARTAARSRTDRGNHAGVRGGRRTPRSPRRPRRRDRRVRVARPGAVGSAAHVQPPADGGQRDPGSSRDQANAAARADRQRLLGRRLDPRHRVAALSARQLRHAAVRRLRLRAQHVQPRRGRGAGALYRQRVLSGGLGEFTAPANEFLVFETGPSETIRLQWATYYDAADEAAISRLYGGIHPSVDDLPGRVLGARVGSAAFNHALALFGDN